MDYLEYKGYKGSVEYSKEDNCLFGKVQGMSKDLIAYEGQTLEELRKDFEAGIDSYIEGCKADGGCRRNFIPVWLRLWLLPASPSMTLSTAPSRTNLRKRHRSSQGACADPG